jgi:hypothetical protein
MARMNISEAAGRLNVSVDSVRRRLRSGALNGIRDERGQWWLDISDTIRPETPPATVDQRLALGVAIPAQNPPNRGSELPNLGSELVEALQDRIDDLLTRLDKAEAERRDDKAKAMSERDRLLTLIETLARPVASASSAHVRHAE